jgi:hypothetical protein
MEHDIAMGSVGSATFRNHDASQALPHFPLEFANQLLHQRQELGETQLVRQFQTHVRANA